MLGHRRVGPQQAAKEQPAPLEGLEAIRTLTSFSYVCEVQVEAQHPSVLKTEYIPQNPLPNGGKLQCNSEVTRRAVKVRLHFA